MYKNKITAIVLALTMCSAITACSQETATENTYEVSDVQESAAESLTFPIEISDYKGSLLGAENWHIEENNPHDDFMYISFINDDTGVEFAYYTGQKNMISAYLADLENDGVPELVCNSQFADFDEKLHEHTQIFRVNNGTIERGTFMENFESFAEENGLIILSNRNYSDIYYPDKNKIILKGEYKDKECEVDIKLFTFRPIDNSTDEQEIIYPVRVDEDYSGPLLGIRKWHVEREALPLNNIENTYFINDETGKIIDCFCGYKDKTSAYLTDLDNNGEPELICNGQYGNWAAVMHDHTQISRMNNGVLEDGLFIGYTDEETADYKAFAEAHNIELKTVDDFTDVFYPDRNKLILTVTRDGSEYEISLDDITFYEFTGYDDVEETPDDDNTTEEINIEYTSDKPVIQDISDTEKGLTFCRDDKKLEGKLFLPEGEGPFLVVVLSCGLQQPYQDYVAKAKGFAENGYAAVVFSFEKYSDPDLDHAEVVENMDEVFVSEAADLNAVLDSLSELPKVDTGSLYLWGHSMGGLVSTYVGCTRSDEIKGFIEVEPAYVIGDGLKINSEPPAQLSIYKLMSECDKPAIIFVGTHDGYGEDPHAFDEAMAAFTSAELKVVDGADHQFEGQAEKEMIRIASEFIAEREKNAKALTAKNN